MVSAICITRNEESNIPRLIESLKDADEVLIFDNESQDKTKEIAEKMGAKVFNRIDEPDIVTRKDIEDFVEKYGYLPNFEIGNKIYDFGKIRNKCLSYSKNDWTLFLDADECVTWDFPEIQKLMKEYDQIECKLIQNPNETPVKFNMITKLFNKNKSKWYGRNHEAVPRGGTTESPAKCIYTDKMKIDHYHKKEGKGGIPLLKNLEYGILKEGDARSMFYAAREYFNLQNWNKAIILFNLCIKTTKWLPELCEAYFYQAVALWNVQRTEEALMSCLNAIKYNANMKKAHHLMTTIIRPEMKEVWKKFEEIADDTDVLFPI